VKVDLEWRGSREPLPADIDVSAFRIIQEAVTNVVRHAGTGQCQVSIDQQEGQLSIEVTDSGHGMSNAEIAAALYITVGTAKAHVARLLAKLDARDRVQLVITAYETDLVSAPHRPHQAICAGILPVCLTKMSYTSSVRH
jgi:nitrate/nitrite-specific signal transduction histidine kinase